MIEDQYAADAVQRLAAREERAELAGAGTRYVRAELVVSERDAVAAQVVDGPGPLYAHDAAAAGETCGVQHPSGDRRSWRTSRACGPNPPRDHNSITRLRFQRCHSRNVTVGSDSPPTPTLLPATRGRDAPVDERDATQPPRWPVNAPRRRERVPPRKRGHP